MYTLIVCVRVAFVQYVSYPAGCCSPSQTCNPGRWSIRWACSSRLSGLYPCDSSFSLSGCWCWCLDWISSPRQRHSRTLQYLTQKRVCVLRHTRTTRSRYFDTNLAKAGVRPALRTYYQRMEMWFQGGIKVQTITAPAGHSRVTCVIIENIPTRKHSVFSIMGFWVCFKHLETQWCCCAGLLKCKSSFIGAWLGLSVCICERCHEIVSYRVLKQGRRGAV